MFVHRTVAPVAQRNIAVTWSSTDGCAITATCLPRWHGDSSQNATGSTTSVSRRVYEMSCFVAALAR
jgi:hypothetical protein